MKLLAPKLTILPFVLAVAAVSVSATPSQAITTDPGSVTTASAQYAHQGDAYGTRVNVANTVTSGPSALVALGCTTTAGIHRGNTVGSVSLPPLLTTGTVTTTADTFASPIQTKTSATVQNLNLLSGIVTATEVRSVSSTTYDGTGFGTSAAGTSFTGLQVAGVSITGTVAPNTRIDLLGFGHVVLNEQVRRVGATSASLTVNAVHLVIDQSNVLGIPVGTNVIVAHATSALRGPVAGTLDGKAYGSYVKLGSVVTSGPSFLVSLPCLGTNGVLKVNDGVGISVPGVLVTEAIHDTAQGTVAGSNASGETTSTVDNANLVSGLVQASVIKADAHSSTDGTTFAFSDAGSSFGTLSVQGFPGIGADVPANTKLTIAGLGTLWLHRVIRTPNSIEVRMIELIVNQSNTLGLPIGTDIRVAVAHASAH